MRSKMVASPWVRTKPSRASLMAGAIRVARGRVPYSGAGGFEAGGGTGHGGGKPGGGGEAGDDVALGVLEHGGGGGGRGFFTKIEEGRAAVREPEGHEAAAADIAGLGVGDGQGVADGDGGIHGVAALAEDIGADV